MSVTFRCATPGDMQKVYGLSNDEEIRQVSYRQERIAWGDHVLWFEGKLGDKNCIFLVIEDGTVFVGQVRFQREADRAEISISLTREYRGRGIGRMVMSLALDYVRFHTSIREVRALVKLSNPASMAYFEKCGYQRVRELSVNGVPSVEYTYPVSRGEGQS
jgi:RimJ/RimL family protein N-acetyltransferase